MIVEALPEPGNYRLKLADDEEDLVHRIAAHRHRSYQESLWLALDAGLRLLAQQVPIGRPPAPRSGAEALQTDPADLIV